MQRRFELGDRYWEIDDNDGATVVRLAWGSVGKTTQRLDRDFAGDRTATVAYVDKQIAAQLAKGYVEVTIVADVPRPALPDSRRARFEWTAVDRHFLEVLVTGTKVHHRSGRLELDEDRPKERVDESATSRFPTPEAAHARFEALCDEARARHVEEIDLSQPPAPRVPAASAIVPVMADYNALEQQCLDAPNAPEPWLVYADHLEAEGDPRGQIAALARAGKAVDRLVLDQLRGIADADDVEDDERGSEDGGLRFDFGFRFGFIRHAEIRFARERGIELDLITRRFLAAPVARFVESLRFGLADFEGHNDWAPTLRAVVESAQAERIRELAFDAFTQEDSELSWVSYGDFGGLLARLPRLERLHVCAGGKGSLGALPPSLKILVRESGGLARGELLEILAAPLPAIEHLELWTGSHHYGGACELSDLARILEARDLPRLRHLGIVDSELTNALIPALAASAILPQLESLDLSRGVATAEAASALVAHARAFRHLASIDLSANLLSTDEVAQIRGALDNVIVTEQRPFDGDHYVAVGE